MSADTLGTAAARTATEAGAEAGAQRALRRFFGIAAGTAVFTYLLIVFGGIVRITGSGLGCGDDWPLCNGRWIPPLEFEAMVEYVHRLLAAGLIVPFGALALLAVRYRTVPGFAGRGGVNRAVALAFALLLAQVLLGAATVKLELPTAVTVLHFVTASSILAALIAAAVRASVPDPLRGDPAASRVAEFAAPAADPVAAASATAAARASAPTASARGRRFARAATTAAALGLLVVAFGALTANTGLPAASGQPSAAAWACQGFPLCNGRWLPSGPGLVHVHWTHRFFAFLLMFHVLGAAIGAWRRAAPRPVRAAAAASLGLVALQIAGAAALVLLYLPTSLQVFHLAIGTAVWGALVCWALLARRLAAAA